MATAGSDFYHYWVVPQAVRDGKYGNIYSAESRRRVALDYGARAQESSTSSRERAAAARSLHADGRSLETVATPFLFAVFGQGATGDYDRDRARFVVLSLACYVAALFALGRLFGFEAAWILVLMGMSIRWFEPVESDLAVGNVNALQLASLALFLGLQRAPRWPLGDVLGGIVLAVAAFLKPVLLPVVATVCLLQLGGRHYRRCARTLGGVLLGSGVAFGWSSLFFGTPRCWLEWSGAMWEVLESGRSVAEGNLGLARLSFEILGRDLSVPLLAASIAGILLAVWAGRSRISAGARASRTSAVERDRFSDAVLGVGLGICLALLSARLAWYHYYVLLLPALLYFLRPPREERGESRTPAVLRAGAAVGMLLLTPLTRFAAQHAWFYLHPLLISLSAMITFLLCLFAIRSGETYR